MWYVLSAAAACLNPACKHSRQKYIHTNTSIAQQASTAHGPLILRSVCCCLICRAGLEQHLVFLKQHALMLSTHTAPPSHSVPCIIFACRATLEECPACVGAQMGATLLLGARMIWSASTAWQRGGWLLGGRVTPPGSPKLPSTPGTNPCPGTHLVSHTASQTHQPLALANT